MAQGDIIELHEGPTGGIDMYNKGRPLLGTYLLVSANYQLAPSDDSKVLQCTTALTVTVPNSLSPRPSCVILPPPSGNVSLVSGGTTTFNGATTTLTRARSSNPAGFAIQAYYDVDGYGVSGS